MTCLETFGMSKKNLIYHKKFLGDLSFLVIHTFNTENVWRHPQGAKIHNQHRYGTMAVLKTLNWENLDYNHYSFLLRGEKNSIANFDGRGAWPDRTSPGSASECNLIT